MKIQIQSAAKNREATDARVVRRVVVQRGSFWAEAIPAGIGVEVVVVGIVGIVGIVGEVGVVTKAGVEVFIVPKIVLWVAGFVIVFLGFGHNSDANGARD